MKLEEASEHYRLRSKEAQQVIRKALMIAAQRTVTHIVANVLPTTVIETRQGARHAPPIDQGHYKAGFRAWPTARGSRIGHVNPKIAAIIEHGVRPGHMKPGREMIRALAAWAHRHGLEGQKEDPERVAWAIAKSLVRYGMAPRKVFERAEPMALKFAQEEIRRAMAKHLKGK